MVLSEGPLLRSDYVVLASAAQTKLATGSSNGREIRVRTTPPAAVNVVSPTGPGVCDPGGQGTTGATYILRADRLEPVQQQERCLHQREISAFNPIYHEFLGFASKPSESSPAVSIGSRSSRGSRSADL